MSKLPMTSVESIITHCAHWGYDEHQYFGYRVFEELVGHETLTGLTALSTLGRRLPSNELGVLDDAATALTLADPRIWPLKLTRTVASYGGSLAGISAGLLAQEDARIGPWAVQRSAELLARWQSAASAAGASLESTVGEYLATHPFVWGFGTPYRVRDERLVAFEQRIRLRERDGLTFWRLFQDVARIVHLTRKVPANMGMAVAAAFLDLGIRPEEMGVIVTALISHMFMANGVEGTQDAPAVLRCLPVSAVRYTGCAPRQSPASRADCGSEQTGRAVTVTE
jgi:hypothetical protein